MAPKVADYGTWKSPIAAEKLASQSNTIQDLVVNESTGAIYYLESRASEEGRNCIVEYANGSTKDLLPKEYNARTKVHEYGGGALAIRSDGVLIFTDANTLGVFSLDPASGNIESLIEANEGLRYAGFDFCPTSPEWIVAIREDHRTSPVLNCLVAINTRTKGSKIIVEGADFYHNPKFSPDGKTVSWIQFDFPDMPWTGTHLYTASWDDGSISGAKHIAGKARVESVSQPRWGPDGTLFFTSDQTGYYQLYRFQKGMSEPKRVSLEGLETSEFSGPDWMVGQCTYVPVSPEKLVAGVTKDAVTRMVIIDLRSEVYVYTDSPIMNPPVDCIKKKSDSSFVMVGRTPVTLQSLYVFDIESAMSQATILVESGYPSSLFSKAQHMTFPRCFGADTTGEAYCFYIPPHNPEYTGPAGQLPPLILSVHGGPTGHSSSSLEVRLQYWTSRGFAVAQLNFTGSSGYGRAFRDKLNRKWGIVDIADAASCVKYLADQGLIDGERAGIRGGSGGGYATLEALCDYPNVFSGGVSEYGVSDLKLLMKDTHKFESHYLQPLLFDEDATKEEQEKIFRDRSPLYHADRIVAPLLLLQGTEDHVVPPNQAIEMERIVKANGGEVKLIFFQGEGHGFRIGRNIWRAIEEEEAWWVKQLVLFYNQTSDFSELFDLVSLVHLDAIATAGEEPSFLPAGSRFSRARCNSTKLPRSVPKAVSSRVEFDGARLLTTGRFIATITQVQGARRTVVASPRKSVLVSAEKNSRRSARSANPPSAMPMEVLNQVRSDLLCRLAPGFKSTTTLLSSTEITDALARMIRDVNKREALADYDLSCVEDVLHLLGELPWQGNPIWEWARQYNSARASDDADDSDDNESAPSSAKPSVPSTPPQESLQLPLREKKTASISLLEWVRGSRDTGAGPSTSTPSSSPMPPQLPPSKPMESPWSPRPQAPQQAAFQVWGDVLAALDVVPEFKLRFALAVHTTTRKGNLVLVCEDAKPGDLIYQIEHANLPVVLRSTHGTMGLIGEVCVTRHENGEWNMAHPEVPTDDPFQPTLAPDAVSLNIKLEKGPPRQNPSYESLYEE
ncbi:hypothetical protein BP5796_05671 [Coleophoma crateriformis]|uniref:Peptidase S9 prolyl oligopeptidase catalytic domain-containing protein n=1 Tax=Coleophoma crateriformis TaxID=565419 RepID=A0A3D8S3U1_9HELO|nr:hypothetical protein BP5796_05671 [Coleophoma crateriformis]